MGEVLSLDEQGNCSWKLMAFCFPLQVERCSWFPVHFLACVTFYRTVFANTRAFENNSNLSISSDMLLHMSWLIMRVQHSSCCIEEYGIPQQILSK